MLAPEVRGRFPKGVEDTFASMNAAHAQFWAKWYDAPHFTIPYAELGYDEIASKLLAALHEVPDGMRRRFEDQILMVHSCLRRMFLNSIFIGGPGCIWRAMMPMDAACFASRSVNWHMSVPLT